MTELTDKELLKLQVDILQKVDAFCRDNSIPYTVIAGTCIGAVRHKGYIPWDDDIDIAMTRPNYERFIHSFNGSVENLEVLAPELNWNYYAPYANVCDVRTILDEGSNGHNGIPVGVKIDVFPLDSVIDDYDKYLEDNQEFSKLWWLLYVKRVILSQLWKENKILALYLFFKRLMAIHLSYPNIQKKIRYLITKYSWETSRFVDIRCYPSLRDTRCRKEIFDSYIDVPFEGIKVSIIKDYDEYLTKTFGNYMEYPPQEERVPHHNFIAYWKD